MENEEHIVRYTAAELDEMRRRGEFDETNWARIDALTDEEVEASIDFEEEGEPDWSRIWVGIPPQGERRSVWVDVDVIDWFQARGDGYQSRMNDVLRRYVEDQKQGEQQDAVAVAAATATRR